MADAQNKTNGFRVRRAAASDIHMLVEFLARLAMHVAGGSDLRLKQAEHDRLSGQMLDALSDEDNLIVVAEDEEANLVGMAYLAILRSQGIWEQAEPVEFRSGIIDDVWVEPPYRERGVFNAMLQALIGYAEKQGVQELVLEYAASNKGAEATWCKLGFKPTGVRAAAFTSIVKQALSR